MGGKNVLNQTKKNISLRANIRRMDFAQNCPSDF
jgi:hypothetical protein